MSNKLSVVEASYEDLSESSEKRYRDLRASFDRQKRTIDTLLSVKTAYEERLMRRKNKIADLESALSALKKGKGRAREENVIDLDDKSPHQKRMSMPDVIPTERQSPLHFDHDDNLEEDPLQLEDSSHAQIISDDVTQVEDTFTDLDAITAPSAHRFSRDVLADWSNTCSVNSSGGKRVKQPSGSEKWTEMAIRGNTKAQGPRKRRKAVF